jgi:hypothetical protein
MRFGHDRHLVSRSENIAESRDSEVCEDQVNEEHDRQVGNNEVVSQDDIQVQVIRHNSSFLRGDNSWKDSHELDQIVIYLEEADLNEKLKGLSIIL